MGIQVIDTRQTNPNPAANSQNEPSSGTDQKIVPIQFTESDSLRCTAPFGRVDRQQYNFLNCINRPQAVFIQDQYLYVAAGRDGLWLLDITDPENIFILSREILGSSANGVVVSGDQAYVAAGRGGILAVEINLPAPDESNAGGKLDNDFLKSPDKPLVDGNAVNVFLNGQSLYWVDNDDQLNFLNLANTDAGSAVVPGFDRKSFKGKIFDMRFSSNLAYIAAGKEGLLVRSTADPASLTEVGQFSPGGTIRSFDFSGNYGYLAVEDIGLMILDITDPANVRQIKETYPTTGTPDKIRRKGQLTYLSEGNTGFYALDANVQIETEILGTTGQQITVYAVAKTGDNAFLASGDRGLRVVDVRNPSSIQEVGFFDTPGKSWAVDIQGNLAYLADGPNGVVLVDVTYPFGRLNSVSRVSTTDALDIAVTQNYAYVADTAQGFLVLDVSDPAAPSLLKQMDPINGETITPNSVAVLGDYAYLADGDKGVRIIDIRDPSIPTQVAQYPAPGAGMDARDVAVVAFNPAASAAPGQDAFLIDPRDPNAQVYAYVANGTQGLLVLDVTKSESRVPTPLSLEAEIAALSGNANSGELVSVQIFRDRAYLAYNQRGIFVLDTTNPATPHLIGMAPLPQSENQVAGLDIDSQTVYAATLTHGLAIFDASQPAQMIQTGQYDAPSAVRNVAVQGNYAYAVDGSRGLWIYDVSDAQNPVEMNFTSIPGAQSIFISGSLAYLACGGNGLAIVDIAAPTSPVLLGRLDTAGSANAVQLVSRNWDNLLQHIALIADGDNGLVIMDVTNPALPVAISGLQNIGHANKLAAWQDYAFVASEARGLLAINISDPYRPVLVGEIQPAPATLGVAVDRGFAYVPSGDYGMPIVQVAQPLSMTIAVQASAGSDWINDVSLMQNYAFQSAGERGVIILDTTDMVAPQFRGAWPEEVPETDSLAVVQTAPQWLPPDADSNKPGSFRLFVADTRTGMAIVSGTQKAQVRVAGVYETIGAPSLASLVAYAKSAIRNEPFESLKTFLAVQQFVLDFFLFGLVGFLLWVGYLALFILPLNHFSDWENLYSRILFYLFGQHGPLIRVKEGSALQDLADEQPNGPGVVLVDSNSAVVLEKRGQPFTGHKDSRLARVVSSGLGFTGNRVLLQKPRFDEVVRGIVDLRSQVRIAAGVNGYTFDGIEVETAVFSIFTLGEAPDVLNVAYTAANAEKAETQTEKGDENPWEKIQVVTFSQKSRGVLEVSNLGDELDDEDKREIHDFIRLGATMFPWRIADNRRSNSQKKNGAPFSVDPVRIFQATYAQADDRPENKQLDWTELPSYIAIEIFRNLLAREIYDHLYEPLLGNQVYPIRDLKTALRIRARNQGILSYRVIRRIDNQPFEKGQTVNDEELLASDVQIFTAPKILRSRGVKMKFAGFAELTPLDESVRNRFLDNWQARREREADITLAGLEKIQLELRNQWRLEAQQEIITEFTSLLQSQNIADEALSMHVLQALEMAADDPDTRQLLPQQSIEMLRNIRTWLMRKI